MGTIVTLNSPAAGENPMLVAQQLPVANFGSSISNLGSYPVNLCQSKDFPADSTLPLPAGSSANWEQGQPCWGYAPTVGGSAVTVPVWVASTAASINPGGTVNVNVPGNPYPVGAIFLSTVATDPATLLGFGTWTQIAQGRMLIGVGTGTDINTNTLTVTEGLGGDAVGEYNHTLAATESGTAAHGHGVSDPGHGHGVSDPTHGHGVSDPGHSHQPSDGSNFLTSGSGGVSYAGGGVIKGAVSHTTSNTTGVSVQTNSTGVSVQTNSTGLTVNNAIAAAAANAHNNVMPYFGVYIWCRTA
jgi:hypothetical protein